MRYDDENDWIWVLIADDVFVPVRSRHTIVPITIAGHECLVRHSRRILRTVDGEKRVWLHAEIRTGDVIVLQLAGVRVLRASPWEPTPLPITWRGL
jgi:hypothetical protein